eukprot:364955-Chlamydomonas_euryale.AAC.1
MTIDKSQGHTLSKVGMYLPVPCFLHGQFHVAMSRVGSPDRIHMLITHTRPKEGEPARVWLHCAARFVALNLAPRRRANV